MREVKELRDESEEEQRLSEVKELMVESEEEELREVKELRVESSE